MTRRSAEQIEAIRARVSRWRRTQAKDDALALLADLEVLAELLAKADERIAELEGIIHALKPRKPGL